MKGNFIELKENWNHLHHHIDFSKEKKINKEKNKIKYLRKLFLQVMNMEDQVIQRAKLLSNSVIVGRNLSNLE